MASLLGLELGNYRLVKELGVGGDGAVYLGQHQHLDFQAAIKVLLGAQNITSNDFADLRKEAQYLVTLKHNNIVTLYDFGIYEDYRDFLHQHIPYLVMEYAIQGTLRTRHPKGTTVGFGTIVSYVQQIARALQFAHDNNIIHRDLKPENLLVFNTAKIKLSDFGIAVITRTTRNYTTREIVGTSPYMAPEQFQGKPHKASDQYALGIIVYEWLTGMPPFTADNFYGYAYQHANVPIPTLPGMISPQIFQVLSRALAKTPEERFGSVKAFAEALSAVKRKDEKQKRFYKSHQRKIQAQQQQDASSTFIRVPKLPEQRDVLILSDLQTQLSTKETFVTPPNTTTNPQFPSPKTAGHPEISRRAVVLGGAAVLAAATGVAGTEYAPAIMKWAKTTLTNLFPPGGNVVFTFHASVIGSVFSASWSPDGKRIASAKYDGTVQVWDPLTGAISLNLESTFCGAVAWSPNGKYIALGGGKNYNSTGTLQVISSADGTVRFTSDEIGYISDISWSPDSKYLAIVTGKEVHICNAGNGDTLLTHQDYPLEVNLDLPEVAHNVAWSPDGKSIASAIGTVLKVWDAVSGSTHITYTGHKYSISSIAWSPDSKCIVSNGNDDGNWNNTSTHIWDAKTGIDRVTWQENAFEVGWASNGEYIASGYGTGIGVHDAKDGSLLARYGGDPDGSDGAVWSPTSRYIASRGYGTVLIWQPF